MILTQTNLSLEEIVKDESRIEDYTNYDKKMQLL